LAPASLAQIGAIQPHHGQAERGQPVIIGIDCDDGETMLQRRRGDQGINVAN
jgi:hypothetical protein